MPDFDVIVLGGGTAGTHVATEVAKAGRATALIEAGLVGGESPYLACMPSKSLLESARRGETWEHAIARRDEITGHLDDAAAAARLAAAGVTLIRGTGQVVEPGTVRVEAAVPAGGRRGHGAGTAELGYGDLVIATGSEPVAPLLDGLADIPTWTSAQALSCPDLPRRLIVLGGGRVGCELAQIYAAFGSQVTIVEAAQALLPEEAAFTGDILADTLRRMGADVRLGLTVQASTGVRRTDCGLRMRLTDGSHVDADRVLLATGRRPRLGGLGLDVLGIAAQPGAGLCVDAHCRVTAAEDHQAAGTRVWAAGDVTGIAPFTHTASYQARIVAANVLGSRREADYRGIPRLVYTTPSVFAAGLSPRRAPAAGIELLTAGFDLAETARATVDDDEIGRVELYADAARGTLVGAAAVGPRAEEWMGEVTVAIRAQIPVTVLADVVHAFPTFAQAIEPPVRDLAERLSVLAAQA